MTKHLIMDNTTKILKLANYFEKKLNKYSQMQTQQLGTSELFFQKQKEDPERYQILFANKIQEQNENNPVYKVLYDYYMKNNGAACSFSLKMTATPGTGASWDLEVSPPQLKPQIFRGLDSIYRKIMGETMNSRLQKANNLAKQNLGSGTLPLGELELF